jgi:signal peptidase I
MRVETEASENTQGGIGETLRIVIQALVLAFIVRIFLYQPFNIPSGSMIPTLLIGDYVFVSKLSYGYSKYSFNIDLPFLPIRTNLFEGRIFGAEPKRGDVIVFKWPRDNETDYIKRLVGLPRDHIQMVNGVLNINGQPVKRRQVEDFVERDENGVERRTRRFEEVLPNGVTYTTLDRFDNGEADNTNVFEIPENHYFMMGDNRDNSTDSRFMGSRGVGYVPRENLVGRADLIFFSVDETTTWYRPWLWPMQVRWSRLLSRVH